MAGPVDLEAVTATLLDAARGTLGLSEKELLVAVRRASDLLRPNRLAELGTDMAVTGEVLEQGQSVRLFPVARLRHLWLGDGGP